MRRADFGPHSPGTLVENLNGHLSFLPGTLPPTLRWSGPLVRVTHQATQAIARLCGLGGRFPRPERLIRLFMRREAEFSSLIEETHASIRTMLLFDHVEEVRRETDAREVQNNYRVLLAGLEAIKERPITLALLRRLHVELFDGLDAERTLPGRFRSIPVFIGSTPSIAEARFVPPPPLEVEHCMRSLVDFVRNEADELPPIVRAAIAHYQFEAIHPFNDGNGRIGRALLLLMMVRDGLLTVPLLNPSAGLERNRRDYYDCLLEVSLDGAWERWIHFFCERVIEEADDAADRLARLDALRVAFHDRTRRERASGTLARVVDELFAEPAQTVSTVAALLNVTPPAAGKTVDRLVALGVLKEVTGRQRDRVFLATEIVDLFTTSPARRQR